MLSTQLKTNSDRALTILNDKVSLKTPTYSFTFMLSMFLAAGFTFFGLAYLTWDYKLTVPIVSTQI